MAKDSEKRQAQDGGNYYHIELTEEEFETYRYHDVGDPGHIQRLAGKRKDGSWETKGWIISKEDAHLESGELIGDSPDAKELLEGLDKLPKHIKGDTFRV